MSSRWFGGVDRRRTRTPARERFTPADIAVGIPILPSPAVRAAHRGITNGDATLRRR